MSGSPFEQGVIHPAAEMAESFDSQRPIEIPAEWTDAVLPFSHLAPVDIEKMAQPVRRDTDEPYFYQGQPDTKTIIVTFSDPCSGKWARFQMVLHPLDNALMALPWAGITPDAIDQPPHTPYGIQLNISSTPDGIWALGEPSFFVRAEPQAISSDFFGETDEHRETLVHGVSFMLDFGEQKYTWVPEDAKVSSDHQEARPLRGEGRDDQGLRGGDVEKHHQSDYFFLPMDERFLGARLTVSSSGENEVAAR